MKKERYKIKLIDEDPMYFDLYDNLKKKYFESPNDVVKVLNLQDARIKELEEALKKANTNNYLTDYYLVEKENQQLKQQLSYEENAHDLCIDRFNEECEKLRKQIKFESEARERFKLENQQLKQAQKQLAIDELVKLRKKFLDMFLFSTFDALSSFIDEQIKKLIGEK